jgi:hypothetical protein
MATPADSTNDTIFQCIVSAFDDQGLNPISSETAKIVWADIPLTVVVKLGDEITTCLDGKGIEVPALAGTFKELQDSNQVTVVSDLISVISQLAG